jgi:hypothetical protein
LGNWLEFGDVRIWHNLVLTHGQTVIGGDSNGVRLISELAKVSGLSLSLGKSESRVQVISDVSKISPSLLSEWSLWVRVIGVDDVVPDSVELVGRVVVLQSESVSTFVSLRKILGVSITGVKRLMDITIVVDQESQSERFTLIRGVDMRHDCLVSNGI